MKKSQIRQIAEFNYEVKKTFKRIFLKDDTDIPWNELDDIKKQGFSAVVDKVLSIVENNKPTGIMSIFGGGCGSSPYSELHEQWMSQKLKGGWRYGQTKDIEERVHPKLLPYDDLGIKHIIPYVLVYHRTRHLIGYHEALIDESKEAK